ncbi:EAL domain-containing protein [Oceanimonas pelagia]|uniref:EAL domain-containing protein n=1 Tax=Oceanimonas pelagia TaxID=3028314 RepID=A0AA50QCS0_9GAMM|nr:LapD/MoxY N-terminal periplasmic domain-containing protein [Oceanimonas pelagia]WMC11527.1 EAL domain-containing protein [Oceanimonas pelagia]
MTLYRQLLLTMLLLFALLFVSAYSVQFSSTRSYLAQQQEFMVINTVTSLGLALTPYLENDDAVGAESVINALFDGGYYRKVELRLLASNKTITRENTAPPQRVPAWFTDLDLFEGGHHQAVLTSGWLQLGQLYVEGHTGHAYYQLWRGMSRLATWFAVSFVLVWALLVLALRHLLKPLHSIEEQAREIEQHHFGKTIPLPATRELRQVVSAINGMSGKLEAQFQEQAAEAERLRHRAFMDDTSGLGNRAWLMAQSQGWLGDGRGGAVVLVSARVLDWLYRDEGFEVRDQMIRVIGKNLRQLCRDHGEHVLARISATEYAMLVSESDPATLKQLGEAINRQIAELVKDPEDDREISVVGIALVQPGDEIGRLLTRADHALNRAHMNETGVVVEAHQQRERLGRLQWKQLLEEALEHDGFELSAQAVMGFQGERYHEEVFVSIRREGIAYGADNFLPVAEQFGLGERLDLHVVARALRMLEGRPELKLAVNLTRQSCHQDGFWRKLFQILERYESVRDRLLLELPESAFAVGWERLIAPLAGLKVEWGVDHFGRHFDLLVHLGQLRPKYVKLDQGYTSQVQQPDYNDAFLAAVCRAAHSMGALTIASRVETGEQVERLKSLHVDAYQGYVSPPGRLC